MLTRLGSPAAAERWLRQWSPGALRTDSRWVEPGDAFIAWPGHASDGRGFVAAALAAGASTCLVEAEGVEAFGFEDARIGALPALKAATGAIAHAWFEQPSERLQVVAVTGTNGKTSSAWWTAQALALCGRRCGVIGTLGIGEPPPGAAAEALAPSEAPERAAVSKALASARASAAVAPPFGMVFTGLTTPDPVLLQAALRRMADAGFKACAIEASSIGLHEHRLAATRIEVAMFTNFTQDHLDFHGSMEAYWSAKRALFDWPGLKAAVVNLDDPRGAALAVELERTGLDLWTYSLERPDARLCASALGYQHGGLVFTLAEGRHTLAVQSALIGNYNAANLLGVIGALRALGVPLADAVAAIPSLGPVPGRMQRVLPGPAISTQPEVLVDYAHTPDALEKALAALRPLAAARGGQLVCVFGCGGNRDAVKRPLMGAIAEKLADRVVLTSDNPRHEAPAEILAQIARGLAWPQAARVVEDRGQAIAETVAAIGPRDVLLIAGKGHEDYQDAAGVKTPFSDVDSARRALAARALSWA